VPRDTTIPSYRHHKQSGQAIVTLTDGLGGRRDILLGRYGTPESKAEYKRVIAEWLAMGRRLQGKDQQTRNITVNELALRYLRHSEQYYRHPDGTPTTELGEVKLSLRPFCHLYGHTLATDFGPLALKAVRQLMIDGYRHLKHGEQPPLCRRVINNRIERIRRAFKWAVENELVPGTIIEELRAVKGLRRGQSGTRETEPVRPVAEAVVEQTLPYMPRQVSAMVQLQLLTGMRPGEVTIMRAIDIDMTGDVWLYPMFTTSYPKIAIFLT
jgi:integrase